ncbi:MAG: Uma2 family endonuclease, partial [Chloroflexota bacterium]
MVAESSRRPRWTLEEYLEMERGSPIKHEFVGGYVYAMSGSSQRHSVLGLKIARLLDEHLDGSSCRAFNSDPRVRLPSGADDHLYPDASVSCDERDLADDDAISIRYPRLVVEVLSRSTEEYDRGGKFLLYQGCPTLEEYVLIATREVHIEVHARGEDGEWSTRVHGPDSQVVLASVVLTFPISRLYK